MFKAYYDRRRFSYWEEALLTSGAIQYRGRSHLKKTACLYGTHFNVYIDTSDGVNEDLRQQEYCGRIKYIIEECHGKPFLVFKSAYSPVWSRAIASLAEAHGGRVVPFFKWSFNDEFYRYTRPRRADLQKEAAAAIATWDIGFGAHLKPYYYPNADRVDSLVSWRDQSAFGFGVGYDTGSTAVATRQKLHDLLRGSRFRFWHRAKSAYPDYLKASFSWRAVLNPPGIGEYTSRMFDHCYIGQCVVLRRSSYDFGSSYKSFLPEVDFSDATWETALAAVLDDASVWAEKARYYFDHYWTPHALTTYFLQKVEEMSNIY